MKEYWTAFTMTQSMFCALPFPCCAWKEEARSKMLLFLPVVGLEIGFLWFLMSELLKYIEVPALISGLFMCALPYFLTGFIHLDGFMDVTDAIGSYRSLERRREILKDSHVGAIAVIWCVFLILAGFAFHASVPENVNAGCLILIPVISRCCSALAVLNLKPMGSSQYANGQGNMPKWHTAVLILAIIICIVAGFTGFGRYGFVFIGGVFGYAASLYRGYRSLEGMNGDISGYCLTISELCAVAVYALL